MLSFAQDTVPVVIYRSLQQILTLSTPQNSQPYKIVTLSLNSNQKFHILDLKSPLMKLMIKISFVLSNRKIVMQHFNLYNNYGILITICCFVKISFS